MMLAPLSRRGHRLGGAAATGASTSTSSLLLPLPPLLRTTAISSSRQCSSRFASTSSSSSSGSSIGCRWRGGSRHGAVVVVAAAAAGPSGGGGGGGGGATPPSSSGSSTSSASTSGSSSGSPAAGASPSGRARRVASPPLGAVAGRGAASSPSSSSPAAPPPPPAAGPPVQKQQPQASSANGRALNGVAAAATAAAGVAPPPSGPGAGAGIGDVAYWDLLQNPDVDDTLARARSASDAAVLRRKGHLKEQDRLIEFMRQMHETHTCEEVMMKMERWVSEYRSDPRRAKLKRMVPTVGSFFTPLRLLDAFREYDGFFHLSRRRYIPPNFAELRHILNIAQVHASAESLRLITFDADGTLYADGHHFEQDNEMIQLFVTLMRSNIDVGIVTAAGYPGDAAKFEARLAGLLQAFRDMRLPRSVTSRFHLMGGECNYLLRVNPATYRLEFVPEDEWQTPEMLAWDEEDIKGLLDEAQTQLLEGAARLCMPVQLIRKTRSVGVVPTQPTIYEVLEELAISLKQNLISKLPFCAFNGGNDVFVDVGNKSLGLDALMRHLDCYPYEVLHVGDRFSDTGNDTATRDCCSIVWVANPEETAFFVRMLYKNIKARKHQPYIE